MYPLSLLQYSHVLVFRYIRIKRKVQLDVERITRQLLVTREEHTHTHGHIRLKLKLCQRVLLLKPGLTSSSYRSIHYRSTTVHLAVGRLFEN